MAARASFAGVSTQPVCAAVPAAGRAWPSTVVPLEGVAPLLQGGEVSGRHEAQFAMEKKPFSIQDFNAESHCEFKPSIWST